jgi:hypothetical protein
MLGQGIMLTCRWPDDRIQIRHPRRNLHIKFTPSLSEKNDFVPTRISIGNVEGTHCLIEWNTTAIRHSEEPEGLLLLIRNWSAVAESAELLKALRWFPFASEWSRYGACKLPFPISNARHSANLGFSARWVKLFTLGFDELKSSAVEA